MCPQLVWEVVLLKTAVCHSLIELLTSFVPEVKHLLNFVLIIPLVSCMVFLSLDLPNLCQDF